eukprot:8183281-Pyramimonas_sp.AAC.1
MRSTTTCLSPEVRACLPLRELGRACGRGGPMGQLIKSGCVFHSRSTDRRGAPGQSAPVSESLR